MILLHVVTESKLQAIEIAEYLIENKLILDAVISDKIVVSKHPITGNFNTVNQTLVMGRTKSLLFNFIDQKLRERYPQNMPVLYSVAIVNMDWEQSDQLLNETAEVCL
jgi:hypothetical protein